MTEESIKNNIGKQAASLIQDGMLVGLGTGSTAAYFIKHLALRCQNEGLKIKAVASSLASLEQAKKEGIPLIDINSLTFLDITVDGADEIDPLKQMIKGGGGALTREKIVASMSKEMIVIVDETKLVSKLGKRKLPVEVLPFAYKATEHKIEKLGFTGAFRITNEGNLFITDNGNYIYDIHFQKPRDNPKDDHEALIHLPGVVETGFFFHLAGRVIIGFLDGQVVIK